MRVDHLAALGDVQRRDGRVARDDPRRRGVDVHGEGRLGRRAVGVLAHGRRARPNRALRKVDVGRRDRVDVDVAGKLLRDAREAHRGAVRTRAAPVVGVVSGNQQQVSGRGVKIQHGILKHDVGRGVGEIEHRARLDGARKGGIRGLEGGRLAGGRLGVARRRLVDDDTVGYRVRGGLLGICAGQRRVVDKDGVESLHSHQLAVLRGACDARDLHVAGGVEDGRAGALGVQGRVGDAHVSAAAVGGDGRAVVALSVDGDLVGHDGAAVGRVKAARVARGGRDAHVLGPDHGVVGGKDAVGALAGGRKAAVLDLGRRTRAHRQQDGVQPVEVAIVAVGVVARLGKGDAGQAKRAAVLGKRGVLVCRAGIDCLVRDALLSSIGRDSAAKGARVVKRHRVGAAAKAAARTAAVGRLAGLAALLAAAHAARRGLAGLAG